MYMESSPDTLSFIYSGPDSPSREPSDFAQTLVHNLCVRRYRQKHILARFDIYLNKYNRIGANPPFLNREAVYIPVYL